MGKVILTEAPERERQEEAKRDEAIRELREAEGRCTTCGVDLATHINSGILICAWSHQEQYEKFLRSDGREA